MKTSKFFLLGATGLIMASCSQEEVNSPTDPAGDAHISINVSIPKEYTTRSFGNGLASNKLNFAVYDADNDNAFVYAGAAEFVNSTSTEVDFNLITGKSYKIAFFAQSATSMNSAGATQESNAVYNFDGQSGTVTVNYKNMTSTGNNADAYDCFYGLYSSGTVTSGNTAVSFSLSRPVAQVNWGTNDLTKTTVSSLFGTNGQYLQSTLSCKPYTTLNLLSGAVSDQAEENISLNTFAMPGASETFGVEDYTYVAMQYLLVPSTSSIMDLTLTFDNDFDQNEATTTNVVVNVSNAPLQANFKTNIYGSLLSSTNSFTINKTTAWSTPANEVDMSTWDGSSVTYPTIPETPDTPVMINRASDLAGLAAMVAGTSDDGTVTEPNTFKDYTISLAADFDMGGNDFAGIGTAVRNGTSTGTGNAPFQGVFDGQGHTISNVKIVGTSNPNDAPGFIGNLDGENAALQNVTFENLQIEASSNEQAGVVGLVTNGATVSDVTVNSGSVNSSEAAGGIVGRVLLNGTVTNCENSASITTSKNAGGIIGAAYYTDEGSSITVSGCKNHGDVNGTSQAVGGIVGLSAADVDGCFNDGSITGATTSTGGIVGQQMSAGSVTNCENQGEVIGGNNYGAGGIVGWVRYQTSGYPRQQIIVVSGNKNSGAVSGTTGVGGIVGIWYMCGVCYGNTNTAPTITATGSFSAGIVGGSQWTEPGTLNSSLSQPDGITDEVSQDMLYVQSNYTNTTKMTTGASLSANYIYVNTSGNTSVFGNSMTETSVVSTPFNSSLSTANSPAN